MKKMLTIEIYSKSKSLIMIAKHFKFWNICKVDKNEAASSVIFWDLSINLKKTLIFERLFQNMNSYTKYIQAHEANLCLIYNISAPCVCEWRW